MIRPLVLAALVVASMMASEAGADPVSQCTPCNPDDFSTWSTPGPFKIDTSEGFEMSIEAAVLGGKNDHSITYTQIFGDKNGRGTYYFAKNHIFASVMYDLNKGYSYLISNNDATGASTCSYAGIDGKVGQYSYNHDANTPVLLPDKFLDLTKIRINPSLTNMSSQWRGADANKYVGCVRDTVTSNTYQLTYHFAALNWQPEDGSQHPTPLGIEICAQQGGFTVYTVTATVVNFHNHLLALPGTGGYHALFTPPSDRFCPIAGKAQKPTLPSRYSFRGEYSTDRDKTASPILLAYDTKFDLIRHDFLPTDPSFGLLGYQHSWVQDGVTGVKYNIDFITGHCSAYQKTNNTVVDFTKGALALIGPTRLKDNILANLDLVNVKPCRRLSCDLFVMKEGNMLYEYSFVSDAWAEKNSGSVNVSTDNVLANVARTPATGATDADGEGVEVFDFSDDQYKLWQFEVADICYKNGNKPLMHRWVRLYFQGDHRALEAEQNSYLRSAVLEAVADAGKISPMRVSGIIFDVFRDQLNVEFIMWEPHPVTASGIVRPNSLQTAINNLKKVVQAGQFVVTVGTVSDPKMYKITADPNTYEDCQVKCSTVTGADTKLMYSDGYTMGMQIAINIPPLPPILENYLPFKTPWNTTYYIEAYHGYADGDQGGHGSLYIYDRHTNFTIVYNEHAKESILVKNEDLSCETKEMYYNLTMFPFGYFHGSIPIPVPDVIADMSRYAGFNLRQRGTAWTHGFKTTVFEATADVSEIAGQKLPFVIPLTVRWNWLDRDFESEDGRYDTAGPVPITMVAEAVVPSIPGFTQFAGGVASAYISVVNYHNHYPDTWSTLKHTKDPVRELLEVPAGVYCEKRIHEPGSVDRIPKIPALPQRFKMKTETVVRAPIDYVINSEDYMDFNRSFFRYDVTMHNPDKPGLQSITQITVDMNADLYFKIDHDARTCEHGKVSEAQKDDPILTHALLAPTELLNFGDLNENYMGIKQCRDMSCYYWVGRRPISSMPGMVGTFEIWSTTLKWHTFEDQVDSKSTTFIKVSVTIRDAKNVVHLKEEIEVYDMQLLGPKDLAEFALPEASFCRGDGKDPDKLSVPLAYNYRGEYVSYDNMMVTTFRAFNDDKTTKLFRYDHAPSQATGDAPAYRSTWLVDKEANILFDVNRVLDTCIVVDNELKNKGGIFDLIYPDTLAASVGDYVGAKPCRSKFCETFVSRTDTGVTGWVDFETFFTGKDWNEFNSDNPFYIDSFVLTRIGSNGYKSDGSFVEGMHQFVDLFEFTQDITREWDYSYAWSCFREVPRGHFRISVTDINGGNALPGINEYFQSTLVSALSMAAGIKPYRIQGTHFRQFDDEIAVTFTLVDHHPSDTKGTSLDDAAKALVDTVNAGFTFNVEMPVLTIGDYQSYPVKIRSIDVCGASPCDINAGRPVIYTFDAATAFGVFFGCFVGGALLTVIALGIFYSRRLRVSVKDVFLLKSPSGPSNPNPVNLSGLSYR